MQLRDAQERRRWPGKPILMRTNMPSQPQIAQKTTPGSILPSLTKIALTKIIVASMLAAIPFMAPAQPTATPATPRKSIHKHHQAPAAHPDAASSQPEPAITAPKPPDWPVNDRPTDATVVWNSQGLHIEASNSTLAQILNDVATATGAKLEGLGQDQRIANQRIFGSYGPGNARDVLVQLLNGSGYNLLLIGGQGQGAPREIVLSAQSTGAAQQSVNVNNQPPANDENADAEDQPQPEPVPEQPPNNRNGFAPGTPPRTPQQIMQEMQQRQQQMLQGNNPQ